MKTIKEESREDTRAQKTSSEIVPPKSRQTVSYPIVYGNTARLLEEPNSEKHTHSWTLFLKPYLQNCNMEKFVRKVVFVLEPYYRNVILTKTPFTVTRTGYGEFSAQIKIFLTCSSRTEILTHYIRLVEYEDRNDVTTPYRYLPLVRYQDYDEIVIADPTEDQRCALQTETTEPEPEFEEFSSTREQTMKKLLEAREKIRSEIEEIKDRIRRQGETSPEAREGVKSGETS